MSALFDLVLGNKYALAVAGFLLGWIGLKLNNRHQRRRGARERETQAEEWNDEAINRAVDARRRADVGKQLREDDGYRRD